MLHLSFVAKTFYCPDNKITEFKMIDSKHSSTAYVILYELIDLWVLDSNRRVGRCVSSWWPLFPPRNSVSIYLCLCILYTSSGNMTYIYIQKRCRPVLLKLRPITVYRTVLASEQLLCLMSLVVWFGFTNCVLLYDDKTNTRVFVTVGIRFKQHFDTRYFVFCNLSPPKMFCPWTLFQNIGFKMVPSALFMSHLDTQIEYSTGDFQALQLIVLVAFGVVD